MLDAFQNEYKNRQGNGPLPTGCLKRKSERPTKRSQEAHRACDAAIVESLDKVVAANSNADPDDYPFHAPLMQSPDSYQGSVYGLLEINKRTWWNRPRGAQDPCITSIDGHFRCARRVTRVWEVAFQNPERQVETAIKELGGFPTEGHKVYMARQRAKNMLE